MTEVAFEQWGDSPPPSAPSQDVQFESWGAPVGVGEDVAKSLGIGLAKAGTGLVGTGGDVRELNALVGSKLSKYLGYEIPQEKISAVMKLLPMLGGPTSQQVQSGVESVTGDFYKPQTPAGHAAQTFGEVAPYFAAGPGGIARKAVGAIGATAGSEIGGALGGPVGSAIGGVAGGLPAMIGAGRNAARAVPTIDELFTASRAQYQAPEVAAVQIRPSSTANLADNIERDLLHGQGGGFRPGTEAPVFDAVNELRMPAGSARSAVSFGNPMTVADISAVRDRLNTIARATGNPAHPSHSQSAAADRAIGQIDRYLENLSSNHADVMAGDPARASEILRGARQDWGAARRAETIAQLREVAQNNAGAANSGANLNNAMRQQIKDLLNRIEKGARTGLSDGEIAQMRTIARGTFTGNVARAIGHLLGSGGGLGAVVTGAVAHGVAGPLGLAAPLVGQAGRLVGSASTGRQINRLDEMIRSRSNLGPQMSQQAMAQNLLNAPPWLRQSLLSSMMVQPMLQNPAGINQPVQ